MTGLDTNVLVRHLMQDDPVQSALASRLVEAFTSRQPGWVSTVVLVETLWVLDRSYGLTREQLAQAVRALLQARELRIEAAEQVAQALRRFEPGRADFADCLISQSALAAGCDVTMSFDARAVRDAGMTLLR